MKKRKIGFVEKEGKREKKKRRIEKYLRIIWKPREQEENYRTARLRYSSTFSTTLSPYPDSREKKVARNFRLTSRWFTNHPRFGVTPPSWETSFQSISLSRTNNSRFAAGDELRTQERKEGRGRNKRIILRFVVARIENLIEKLSLEVASAFVFFAISFCFLRYWFVRFFTATSSEGNLTDETC